jgi:hypothetical protein
MANEGAEALAQWQQQVLNGYMMRGKRGHQWVNNRANRGNRKWTETGDQIILMIDAPNEDNRNFAQAIQATGLRLVLLECHGQNAPATYNGGTDPIDGIFASPSIGMILIGGYLEFGLFTPMLWRSYT